MIVTNKTRHAVVYGKTVLLPGSNVVDDFDASKYPLLADMKKSGALEVVENATEKDIVAAINSANTQKVVDKLAGKAKSGSVKAAADARKKVLDDFDAEVAKAGKAKE